MIYARRKHRSPLQRPELLEQALTPVRSARVEALGGAIGASSGDTRCLSFWETPCWDWSPRRLCFIVPQISGRAFAKLRAHLSGRGICCGWRAVQIGHYMLLGRGEKKSGGRNKASLLVDALEAILAGCIWMAVGGGADFILRAIVERNWRT